MQALELFETFIRPLERAALSYFATGSVASIIYGEPRLTHDIDIVIHLQAKDVEGLMAVFPAPQYYCPPAEVIHIELQRRPFAHFNVIHPNSGLKADFYPDAGDPLHAWAFQKRRQVALSEQLNLWVAPPEYVIIRKLEYHREGGSEKHLQDIRKMVVMSGDILDRKFLETELERRGLLMAWKACGGE